MAGRLSRRDLAEYVAGKLMTGDVRQRNKVLQQLAAYLIHTRRTREVDLIVRDVQYVLSERGIVSGKLLSAFELGVETKAAIAKLVKSHTDASKVVLDTEVDTTLLGGIKISLPGRELDQTIAHQLTILKTRFKKA